MSNSTEHRSTTRVLDALELVAGGGRDGYTLTELCQRLDVPKSSMFPILHTLCERGYLTLHPDSGRYTTGPSALRLGNAYLENIDALDEITKELRTITAACSETSYFATLKGGNAFYLAKADSPEPIRMVAAIGHSLPAYSTGRLFSFRSEAAVSSGNEASDTQYDYRFSDAGRTAQTGTGKRIFL